MPTDSQLASMSQSELLDLRKKATTQEEQNRIAGFEHRAFAREQVQANPINAVGLAIDVPGYYAAKKTGVVKGRSEASLEQVKQGFKGIAEGMDTQVDRAKAFFGQSFSSAKDSVEETVSNAANTAAKFFGMDFSSKKEIPKAPTESTPPQKDVVEEVFPKLLQAESKGKHLDESGKLIKSAVGAEGISQLMPSTAKNPGYGIEGVKDKSEEEYLRVGKEYLRKLYTKFGDMEKALAAYNAGVGNVIKAEGKADRFGGNWKDYLPKKQETLPYLERILGNTNGKKG